jgi:predicted ATPase
VVSRAGHTRNLDDVSRSRKYIVTGGPGSGKSTLVEALGRKGLRCFPEVAREVIRREAARPGGVMPWTDLLAFSRLALPELIRQHDQAGELGGTCVFDRGLPDLLGYLRHGGHGIPEEFIAAHAAYRYETTVFILPPWREIYVNDSERPQSFDLARSLHEAIRETYESLGYRMLELPKQPVADRCDIVLAHLRETAPQR